MNSSCGLCERVTIESLRVEAPDIRAEWMVTARVIGALPDALRRAQAVFEKTGGLHAAGLFEQFGALELIAEDVGRHNAVDKIVGRMLLDERLRLGQSILFVSGRTSYEIVQKAFLAGIPVVGAVSAPSSLAVELAEGMGITRSASCAAPRSTCTRPGGVWPAESRSANASTIRVDSAVNRCCLSRRNWPRG